MNHTPQADSTRAQILQAAAQLFMSRGYDKTSVQSIINAVGIAKGTFYHHFRSKSELLDAWVHAQMSAGMAVIAPILADPGLTAVDKFNAVGDQSSKWKLANKAELLSTSRALHAPENVRLYQRIVEESHRHNQPKFAALLQQGVDEGSFTVDNPAVAAQILLAMGHNLSEQLNALILATPQPEGAHRRAIEIIRGHTAAINRIVGAPPGTIALLRESALERWFE